MFELAPGRILEHLIEAWTAIAALSPADTGVVVLLDNLPAPPLGDLARAHGCRAKGAVCCNERLGRTTV
jgi:hypothetical protein